MQGSTDIRRLALSVRGKAYVPLPCLRATQESCAVVPLLGTYATAHISKILPRILQRSIKIPSGLTSCATRMFCATFHAELRP